MKKTQNNLTPQLQSQKKNKKMNSKNNNNNKIENKYQYEELGFFEKIKNKLLAELRNNNNNKKNINDIRNKEDQCRCGID